MPKANVQGLNMYYEFAGEGEPLVRELGSIWVRLDGANSEPGSAAQK
jgi:hypothetical protein